MKSRFIIHNMPYTQLFQQLSNHDTVLTPNKRLSRYITNAYNQYQAKTHISINCIPYSIWQNQLYRQMCQQTIITTKQLLNQQQQLLLWKEIIYKRYTGLQSVTAMAKQAQAAWVLLNDFNLDVGDPRIAKTFDGEHFQSWCLEYMQTLEQNAWLDQACLNQELISIISQNNLKQKQLRLFCVGFLDPTPAQLSLWQILQRQKHEIIQISEQNDINKSSSKIDFDHPDAELLAMAEFAKKHHASSKHQSLAFILPDLNQRYQNIDRVFRQTFKMPLAENHKLPFAISFGAALNKHALIETALLILGLGEKNSHDIINQLLLSPFLDGAEQESQARAQLTDDINQRPFSITLKQLTLLCEKNSPIFSSILCKFKPYKKAENTLEACLNSFIERLNGFGFPGQGMLTSHDFQVLNQFKTTLYDLMKLQLIQKPCSIYHALNLLRQACKDTLFQAESNLQANIHVLGILEATDIPFDTVWQSGLSEKDWPQNHGINPFLPAPLQSELKMPGADPEHNTQFHETLIRNRIKSCHTFIASYISQENDVHVEATYCIKNVTTVVSEPPSSTEANSASKIEYCVQGLRQAFSILIAAEQVRKG